MVDHNDSRLAGVGRFTTFGVVGGLVGAVAMAMYAMIVSVAVKDVGFFTPLYHIGSAFFSPAAMMTSMERAADGDGYYFTLGPALAGMIVHLMTGAVAGGIFGALAALLRMGRLAAVLLGVVYGLLVLLGNGFVGLPVVADLFGGGKAISDMPNMVGWGTFTVEHVLYGLVLGLVTARAVGALPSTARRLSRSSA